MKSIFRFLFVATLTSFLFSQAMAQTAVTSGTENASTGTRIQGNFVDKNNNGICDNHEIKGSKNQCANFVDKDGNGICDNCPGNAKVGQNANWQGRQYGNGCGQGKGNCCGRGPCGGNGRGKCCQNQQGTLKTTPVETPDPKK